MYLTETSSEKLPKIWKDLVMLELNSSAHSSDLPAWTLDSSAPSSHSHSILSHPFKRPRRRRSVRSRLKITSTIDHRNQLISGDTGMNQARSLRKLSSKARPYL